jgi:thioredoxin reductase (NADPH)
MELEMPEKAMKSVSDEEIYDILIVGGGPAGLSAGIYGVRSGKKTILLEGKLIGGQLFNTDHIDNYLGFSMIPGYQLAEKMEAHARKVGLQIEMAMANKIFLGQNDLKMVEAEDGKIFKSRTVIFAAGGNPRYLNVPGEAEYSKRGVSYCAVCDGPFFKGHTIAVAGGGDSACEEAIYLTNHAAKVYIIHRRDELRAGYSIQQSVFKNPKIEVIWDSVIEKINGGEAVESAVIKNVKTGEKTDLPVTGVFIFIGYNPNTNVFDFQIEKNKEGYLVTDSVMQTSVPGIFAIGDVRAHIARQISIASGDGATAALAAVKLLDTPENG